MDDEKTPVEETQQSEPTVEEPVVEDPNAPKWEHRTTFKINDRMKEVIEMTIRVTESELTVLRRKLQKLTYGS